MLSPKRHNVASQRGTELLDSYRKRKPARKSTTSDQTDDISNAVLDGSLLAFKYFETKSVANNVSATSPLDTIRLVSLRLSDLKFDDTDSKHMAIEISSLLQSVEEYLVNISHSEQNSIISSGDQSLPFYSPSKPHLKLLKLAPEMRGVEIESFSELNETKMDYYEEVVNDLVEKLEKLKDEKDDLQLISNALGERLQRISKEKEDAISSVSVTFNDEIAALRVKNESLQKLLSDKDQKILDLEEQVESYTSQQVLVRSSETSFVHNISRSRGNILLDLSKDTAEGGSSSTADRRVLELYMKNQLDLNSEEFERYEQMINELLEKVEMKESEILKIEKNLSDVSDDLNNLRHKEASLEQALEEAKEDKLILSAELEALEQKYNSFEKIYLENLQELDGLRENIAQLKTIIDQENTAENQNNILSRDEKQNLNELTEFLKLKEDFSEVASELEKAKEKNEWLEQRLKDNQEKTLELSELESKTSLHSNFNNGDIENLKLQLDCKEAEYLVLRKQFDDLSNDLEKSRNIAKELELRVEHSQASIGLENSYSSNSFESRMKVQINQLHLLQETLDSNKVTISRLREENERYRESFTKVSGIFVQIMGYVDKNASSEMQREKDSEMSLIVVEKLIVGLSGLSNHLRSHSMWSIEIEKLQARLDSKQEHIKDLSTEMARLQSVLDAKCAELDILKFDGLKDSANSRLIQLDKDNEFEILSDQVTDLNEQLEALIEETSQKDILLREKDQEGASLKALILKLEEKDETTEQLLERLRYQNSSQTTDIESMRLQLLTLESELFVVQSKCQELESQLSALSFENSSKLSLKVDEFTVTSMNNEIESLKSQLQDVINDNLLKQQKLVDMQIKLRKMNGDFEYIKLILSESLKSSTDAIEEKLLKFVDAKISAFNMRIEKASKDVDKAKISDPFTDEKFSIPISSLADTLQQTQLALKHALERQIEDSNSLKAASLKLDSQESIIAELRSRCDEFLRILGESPEGPNELRQKISALEKKLADSTSDQAKKFSQSTRIVAYLESEYFRLHGLCDHFKTINFKLSRTGRSYAPCLNCRSFEIRNDLLLQQESAIRKKLALLDEEFIAYRHDQTSLVASQKEEFFVLEKHLKEQIDEQVSYIASLHSQIVNSTSEKDLIQDRLEKMHILHRRELSDIAMKGEEAAKQIQVLEQMLELKESLYNDVLSHSKDSKLIALRGEEQVAVLSDEVSRLSSELTRRELEFSRQTDLFQDEKNSWNKKIQATLATLSDKEKELMAKETEVAESILRNSTLIQEKNDLLEDSGNKDTEIEALSSTISMLRNELKVLSLTCESQKEVADSKQSELSCALERIEVLSDSLQLKSEENKNLMKNNETLSSNVEEAKFQIDGFQVSLMNLTSKYELVDKENRTLASQLEALELTNETQKAELQSLEHLVSSLSQDLKDAEYNNSIYFDKIKALEEQQLHSESIHKHLEYASEFSTNQLHYFNRLSRYLRPSDEAAVAGVTDNGPLSLDSDLPQTFNILLEVSNSFENLLLESIEKLTFNERAMKTKIDDLEIVLENTRDELLREKENLSGLRSLEKESSTLSLENSSMRKLLSELSSKYISQFRRFKRCFTCVLSQDSRSIVSLDKFDLSNDIFTVDNVRRLEDCEIEVSSFFEKLKDAEQLFATACLETEDLVAKQSQTLLRIEKDLLDKSSALDKHITVASAWKAELVENMEQLKKAHSSLQDQSNLLKEENAGLIKVNQQLQADLSSLALSNMDITQALRDLEIVCEGLKVSNDLLQSGQESKHEDFEQLSREVEMNRRRAANLEIQLEKQLSMSNRLKAEKEAFESVVHNLSSEIERFQEEKAVLISFKEAANSLPQIQSDFYRVINSIDMLIATTADGLSTKSSNEDYSVLEYEKLASISVTNSVTEQFISKVSKFSFSLREEMQKKRQLEQRLSEARAEARELKDINEEIRSAVAKQKIESHNSSLITISKHEHLEDKFEVEDSRRIRQLESENKDLRLTIITAKKEKECIEEGYSVLADEIATLKRELHESKEELKSFESSLSREAQEKCDAQEKYSKALSEIELLSAKYDSVKQNNEKLLSSIKNLEKSLEGENSRRQSTEKQSAEHASLVASNESLSHQMKVLQSELERAVCEGKNYVRDKVAAEEHVIFMGEELEALRKQNRSLEQRINMIFEEKSFFLDKITETHQKLHDSRRAKSQKDVKSTGTQRRQDESLELSIVQSKMLDSSNIVIEQLTYELQEKDAKLSYEAQRRQKVENELEFLRTSHGKLNEDVTKLRGIVASFRKEGRDLRSSILQIINTTSEILQAFNMDVRLQLIDGEIIEIDFLNNRNVVSHADMPLAEVLGVHDLVQGVESLRVAVNAYRTSLKKFKLVDNQLDLAKKENRRLIERLQQNEEAFHKLQEVRSDETSKFNSRIEKLQKLDNQNHLRAIIAELEAKVSFETGAKESALTELKKLKSSESAVATSSINSRVVEEVSELRKENNELKSTLECLKSANLVQKTLVERLESKLISDGNDVKRSPTVHSSGYWRAICSTYREILLSSIESHISQSLALQINHAFRTVDSQIETLCAFYDEEINIYKIKVKDLLVDLNTSRKYEEELGKQWSEQVKSLYRSGKGTLADFSLRERDALRKDLERRNKALTDAEECLIIERERNRIKNSQLLQNLARVIKERDIALAALYQIEVYCSNQSFALGNLAVYEELHKAKWIDVVTSDKQDIKYDANNVKTIGNLIRGLMEADKELVEFGKRDKMSDSSLSPNDIHDHAQLASSNLRDYASITQPATLSETFLTNKNTELHQRRQHSSGQLSYSFALPTIDSGNGVSSLRISRSRK